MLWLDHAPDTLEGTVAKPSFAMKERVAERLGASLVNIVDSPFAAALIIVAYNLKVNCVGDGERSRNRI